MKHLEAFLEWGGVKKDAVLLLLSALSLAASISGALPLPFDPAWGAIVLCGAPILLEAFIGLVAAFDIKADVLVSLALIASVCIGEHFAAGEVAFIMQLGALLEDLTAAKARAGIEKLVRLTPRTARIVSDGAETVVPAEEVRAGQILRVLPGETAPVDGVILSGQTSIDQSVMTGESLPVDKGPGDEVFSGTVNQFGVFDMRAVRVGEDSSLQRMIRLVQSADAGKAKIVRLADRWATWIVIAALSAAVLTWLFTGEIIRAVTILVVFCPCALVLATPTAIMAAIGCASKHGFLVREGDALERLASVTQAAFDKTGTLTSGTPQVVEARSLLPELPWEQLYALAAAAEARSEHPLGKSVARCFRAETGKNPPQAQSFQMIPGQGVLAEADGKRIAAGNLTLLRNQNILWEDVRAAQEFAASGATVIYLAVDGVPAGFLALSDTLRPQAARTVRELQESGIVPTLLTGDGENAARRIAEQTGIAQYRADCLPEDKLAWIDQCQADGRPVCMVGDGVNDAPALKRALVGIAMGGAGSDIAVDAADIALVSDDIRELPFLFRLSRRMMRTIRRNLAFSMTLNFIAIALAITGLLGPVVGALVHNAGSVFVIVNSALLLGRRDS